MDSASLSSKKLLIYVFFFCFIVRMLVGFLTVHNLESLNWIIAQNIVQAKGFSLDGIHPTAFLTPGYPLILAVLMALFGEQKIPFIIFLAAIGAMNASLCGYLGIKLFNRKTGLIAGLWYAFIPYLAQKEVATEGGLVTLGLLAAVCLLLEGYRSEKLIFIWLSGFMFSFSYLVRPDVGLIPLFIFLSLIFSKLLSKKTTQWHLTAAFVFMLAFTTGIMPWAMRNKQLFGRLYFARTDFWYTIYTSNHRRTFEVYPQYSLDNFLLMIPIKDPPPFHNEFETEEYFRKLALTEIKNLGPKEIIKRSFKKLIHLWDIRLVPYNERIGNDFLTGRTLDKERSIFKNLTFSIHYQFLLLFAAVGCWQERRRIRLLLFITGFLLFFSIPYLLAAPYSRYSTHIYFILILMASCGLRTSVRKYS